MKYLKVVLIVLFATASCLSGSILASAQIRIIGVKMGYVFIYEMFAVYTSDNSDVVARIPGFELNNTEKVAIRILSVSGTKISHVYTLHLKNGTAQTIVGETDVAVNSWTRNVAFRGLPICPANLKNGEQVPSIQLPVNKTLLMTFPGGIREMNQVAWKDNFEEGTCIFDKETGMLLTLCREHLYADEATGEVTIKIDVIKMTRTNAWSDPMEHSAFPPLALFGAIVAELLELLVRGLREIEFGKLRTLF